MSPPVPADAHPRPGRRGRTPATAAPGGALPEDQGRTGAARGVRRAPDGGRRPEPARRPPGISRTAPARTPRPRPRSRGPDRRAPPPHSTGFSAVPTPRARRRVLPDSSHPPQGGRARRSGPTCRAAGRDTPAPHLAGRAPHRVLVRTVPERPAPARTTPDAPPPPAARTADAPARDLPHSTGPLPPVPRSGTVGHRASGPRPRDAGSPSGHRSVPAHAGRWPTARRARPWAAWHTACAAPGIAHRGPRRRERPTPRARRPGGRPVTDAAPRPREVSGPHTPAPPFPSRACRRPRPPRERVSPLPAPAAAAPRH